MNEYIIPISFVFELDDLGWDDGHDLRLYGKASRSGFPRRHCYEDYEVLTRIAEKTGKSLSAAIVVGDWDKDNLMRGKVGFTHQPYDWDRASEINLVQTRRMIDLIESSPIDYMVHGMLHGRYDENGKQVNEHEYILFEQDPGGNSFGVLPSEEDMRERLDMFFAITKSWGMKKPFRGFVNPGGLMYSDDALVERMSKVLYDYGIRYWADPFLWWDDDEVLKVYNGVACFRWKRNKTHMPWDAYDIDPDTLNTINSVDDTKKSCLHGSHWTNFLRFNTSHSLDYLPAWERFYKRQGEVWGAMNAANLAEAVNQLFYYKFAKVNEEPGYITIDLGEVEKNKLDCHKNEFFLSLRNGVTPSECIGGSIEMHEIHDEFTIFKITHTEPKIKIRLS